MLHQSNHILMTSRVLLALLSLLFLTGCPSKKAHIGEHNGAVSVTQEESLINHGGADPSGGEGDKSEFSDLELAVAVALEKIDLVFHRIILFDGPRKTRIQAIAEKLKTCQLNTKSECENTIADAIAGIRENFKIDPWFEEGSCPQVKTNHVNADMSISTELKLCVSKALTRYTKKEIQLQVYGLLAHEVAHGLGFNEELAASVQSFVTTYPKVVMINDLDMHFMKMKLGKELSFQIAKLSHYLLPGKNSEKLCYELDSIKDLFDGYYARLYQTSSRIIMIPYDLANKELTQISNTLEELAVDCKSSAIANSDDNFRRKRLAELENAFNQYYEVAQKLDFYLLRSSSYMGQLIDYNSLFLFEFAKRSLLLSEAPSINSLNCDIYENQNSLYQRKITVDDFEWSSERVKTDEVLEGYVTSMNRFKIHDEWFKDYGYVSHFLQPILIKTFKSKSSSRIGVEVVFKKDPKYVKKGVIVASNADRMIENNLSLKNTTLLKVLERPGDYIEGSFELKLNPEFHDYPKTSLQFKCTAVH